jgi:hypothetical protein
MLNIKNTARATGLVVALLASAGAASAQSGTPPAKPAPPARGVSDQAGGAAKQAKEMQGVEVTLPVKGLTKENAPKAQTALAAIMRETYTCSACKVDADNKGVCPGCAAELKMEKRAVLAESKLDPEKGTLVMTTNPGAVLTLSSVERALKSASAQVDEEKMTVVGHAMLVYGNVASEAEATALQKVLTEAKLFQSVRARFDATSKGTRVEVMAAPTGPTKAILASTLERAGSKAKLNDITWGTPHVDADATAGNR